MQSSIERGFVMEQGLRSDGRQNGKIRPDVWRERLKAVKVVTLPSGQDVKVRKLNPMQLMRSGVQRPTDLAGAFFSLLRKCDDRGNLQIDSVEDNQLPMLMKLMEAYFIEAVVEPRIVLLRADSDDDSICIEDVDATDIMFLFMQSDEARAQAAKREEAEKDKNFFREAPGTGADIGRGGESVRAEAEQINGGAGDGQAVAI